VGGESWTGIAQNRVLCRLTRSGLLFVFSLFIGVLGVWSSLEPDLLDGRARWVAAFGVSDLELDEESWGSSAGQ